MHGREGEERRNSWHMLPVPPAHRKAAGNQQEQQQPPPSPRLPLLNIADSNNHDFFLKDGRKICVGDCALFQSGNSPAFIGIIRWFLSNKEGSLKLGVNWLYRPADVKLAKGTFLEAAPNEVFYSFHKDEISVQSLLHPCKVAFLRKDVELPSSISSFVCRRVYDIANKCLWWLTDQDYINERQEEVDHLLERTRLEMHATAVQSGSRSPKPLNGSSSQQLKTGSDNIQNSSTSGSLQGKGKRKEKVEQGSETIKKDIAPKVDNEDSNNCIVEGKLKADITKIAEKGALLNCEGVDKLVQLMQTDKSERKIDLSGRIMLADVIASTDSVDCLGRFVQLRGVPVLDDWLQEAHKGKVGDSTCLKENDKSVDELLLALLRALDKLPVNLHVLQTSNIGKSVNNLRGHKNLEIHKKARSLVDTWKKRVDAEMTMINDMKPVGSSQTIPWSAKSGFSEVCQGNRHTGSSDLAAKMSHTPSSSSKILPVKVGHGDHLVKSPSAPTGSSKLPLIAPSSVGICSKDVQCKVIGISGSSELQLAKEEKSSGSSQSQNNSQSCSSGHAKTLGTATKEDAKSSTAGSTKASKTSSGVSRHKRSSNGFQGTTVSRSDKEANVGKSGPFSRNTASSRVSQPGLTSERSTDISALDHGNGHRLIVRLPNPGRTPAQSTGSGPIEEHPSVDSRASSPAASEKHEQNDQKVKAKGGSASQAAVASCATSESWQGNETKGSLLSDGGQLSGALNETHTNKGENEKSGDEFKVESVSSANEKELLLTDSKLGKSYHPSFSSIHALIESCVKYSERGASLPDADDNGMNLLASVAAGQLCKSDLICPASSPIRCSPMQEDHSNVDKAEPEFSSPGEHDDRVNEASERHKGSDLHKEESSKLASRNPQHNVILQEHKPTEEHELSMISRGKHDEEPDVGEDHMSSSAGQVKKDDMEISGANKLLDKLMLDMQFNNELLDSKHNLGNSLSERLSSGDCAQEKIAKHCTSLEDCGDNTHATSDKASLNEEVKEPQPCPSNMVVQHTHIVNEESTAVADTNQQLLSSSAVKQEVIGSIQNESSSSISAVSNPEPLKNVLPGNTNSVGTGNHSGPHDSGKEQLPAHSGRSILVSCTVKKDLHKDEVYKHLTDVSAKVEEAPSVPTPEVEQSPNSTSSRVVGCEGHESELACHADGSILHNSLEPDSAAKRGFDLNEGIAAEEASHGEKSISFPLKCSPAVLHPVLTPFTVSPVSGGSVPVTVAAPAKGPFVPPEDLFVYRDKLGWKGSAATSAFRPAEPRRLFEMPLNSSEAPSDTAPGKQIRAGLDIDLNVADVQVQEDIASQSSAHSESGGATAFTCVRNVGLDLDLNKVDEITETGQVPESSSRVLEEATFLPVKSAFGASMNGEVGAPRDFDLNDGPSLDEVGGGPVTRNQPTKSNSMPFVAPGGLRMSNAELGNLSPWFLPGNTYSAVAIPSFLPDRGDQAYPLVTPAGAQRFMGSATGSFVGDIYRNPVLSSSPAMVFSPAATFPYASFPFGSSFPLGSTSITGGPTTSYADSSSGGPGFPTIPPQLVGSPNAVTPAYIRPNMMSLQECSTSGGSEGSRKWGRQSLDLNAGPGIIDFEGRDERLASSRQMSLASSHAFAEEQARIHQIANGTLKRKEPEGGWDMDRYSYKQHSWQ